MYWLVVAVLIAAIIVMVRTLYLAAHYAEEIMLGEESAHPEHIKEFNHG